MMFQRALLFAHLHQKLDIAFATINDFFNHDAVYLSCPSVINVLLKFKSALSSKRKCPNNNVQKVIMSMFGRFGGLVQLNL